MAKYRKIKRYGTSYGRRRRRKKVWKWILFILLLAVLVFIGYSFANSISDLMNRPASSEPESSFSESEAPGSSPSSLPEESSEPEPEPEPQESLRAIVIPAQYASDPEAIRSYLDTVDQALYNCAVIDLKDTDGILGYQSEIPLAQKVGAVSGNAADGKAIVSAIEASGFIPAARIFALEDRTAATAADETCYIYQDQADVAWFDRAPDAGGKPWLNPYMDNAVGYLSGIAGELSDAGFKALFARAIQYPDTPYLEDIGYGPNGDSMTAKALQQVIDALAEAAGEEMRVIPVFDGPAYLGENDQIYAGSPNSYTAGLLSPVLPEGQEEEILAAVTAGKEALVPTLSSAGQIDLLTGKGILQYLVDGQ